MGRYATSIPGWLTDLMPYLSEPEKLFIVLSTFLSLVCLLSRSLADFLGKKWPRCWSLRRPGKTSGVCSKVLLSRSSIMDSSLRRRAIFCRTWGPWTPVRFWWYDLSFWPTSSTSIVVPWFPSILKVFRVSSSRKNCTRCDGC